MIKDEKEDKKIKWEEGSSWTEHEQIKFSQAVILFGHEWHKVAQFIGSRTPSQVSDYFEHIKGPL